MIVEENEKGKVTLRCSVCKKKIRWYQKIYYGFHVKCVGRDKHFRKIQK